MVRAIRQTVAVVALAGVMLPGIAATADPGTLVNADVNVQRARINYMLNCQGCHSADGSGSGEAVPRMKDYVGNFLRVPGGREYLVRVPGSANAALDDALLAELLNWMMPTLAPDATPSDFVPYTAAEVGALRAQPLNDVATARERLVASIEALTDASY